MSCVAEIAFILRVNYVEFLKPFADRRKTIRNLADPVVNKVNYIFTHKTIYNKLSVQYFFGYGITDARFSILNKKSEGSQLYGSDFCSLS